jgi:hypothetical protein
MCATRLIYLTCWKAHAPNHKPCWLVIEAGHLRRSIKPHMRVCSDRGVLLMRPHSRAFPPQLRRPSLELSIYVYDLPPMLTMGSVLDGRPGWQVRERDAYMHGNALPG